MLVSWRETAAAANLFYPCRAWPSVFLLPRLMSESPFFRKVSLVTGLVFGTRLIRFFKQFPIPNDMTKP